MEPLNLKRIYVLTYDRPHRKTQDLLFRLKAHGYSDVIVLMQEWVNRKTHTPLITMRPQRPLQISMKDFCKRLDMGCADIYYPKVECALMLIGGANILPKEMTDKYRIINAHPGILPKCRGLDSVKWAIYNGNEVGVTTHIINEEIDSGELIDQRIIDIEYTDSFHGICNKVYEAELEMLVEAVDNCKNTTDIFNGTYKPSRRMPHKQEAQLFDKFNSRRINGISKP